VSASFPNQRVIADGGAVAAHADGANALFDLTGREFAHRELGAREQKQQEGDH
jgi:hypothetical protein